MGCKIRHSVWDLEIELVKKLINFGMQEKLKAVGCGACASFRNILTFLAESVTGAMWLGAL